LGISDNLKPSPKLDSVPRIGTLGQMDKRKRMDLLIKAFRDSKFDGELVIAGQGMDYPLLKALAGDDRRIKFLGMVSNEKLPDFYNSLDLFIFPTWIEGYGLPPVEAMRCGKNVVVMSDAVIPKEVKSRCLVVDNLAEIINNKDVEALSKIKMDNNLGFANMHSWDSCVESYLELYKEIANG